MNFELGIFFGRLDSSEELILEILNIHGPLSQREITEFVNNEKYSKIQFQRWGVKNRMNGKGKYCGLKTLGFVFENPINNKEKKYCLTLKGFFEVSDYNFEESYFIKKFNAFLQKQNADKNIIHWANKFIKAEISLILQYHDIVGHNWEWDKHIAKYWNEFKKYDRQTIRTYFDHRHFEFRSLLLKEKREFLKAFFVLDELTEPIKCVFSDYNIKSSKFPKKSIRNYIDRWYLIFEKIMLNQDIAYNMIELNSKYRFNENEWLEECEKQKNEAKEILNKIKQ
ncbi:MAG: hypothetical protein K5798_03945 [Nitrosopumilus sp.]|uniref:hypothetical protein n=1 Tax=Nitrosopumilus sp. TaxID=2024843 RepID=UPI0024322EEC|nr:hypothetical protein [Nitrosopumilus sp.]MCV0366405.1 hypothetical protein [Nitrosopumilus sp.]